MKERLENLHAIIAELESELGAIDSVDSKTRSALEEVVADIQAALEESGESGDAGLTEPEKSFTDRLQDAESQFEASHPTISGLLLRVIDALGQLGI